MTGELPRSEKRRNSCLDMSPLPGLARKYSAVRVTLVEFHLRHPERGLFRYSLTYDVSSLFDRSFLQHSRACVPMRRYCAHTYVSPSCFSVLYFMSQITVTADKIAYL